MNTIKSSFSFLFDLIFLSVLKTLVVFNYRITIATIKKCFRFAFNIESKNPKRNVSLILKFFKLFF